MWSCILFYRLFDLDYEICVLVEQSEAVASMMLDILLPKMSLPVITLAEALRALDILDIAELKSPRSYVVTFKVVLMLRLTKLASMLVKYTFNQLMCLFALCFKFI